MSNEPTTHITFTAEAALAIGRMRDRLTGIRYWHGPDEAARAGVTMAHGLASLIGMGGTVYGDRIGDSGLLNLVAHTTSGMTVGMVFHREDIRTTVARCHPGRDVDEVMAMLTPETTDSMTESGEWSLHS